MGKNLQTNVWKINKMNSAKAKPFFNLGEYNLLPSVFKVWFINCEKFNFERSYFLSDSHTNTVICDGKDPYFSNISKLPSTRVLGSLCVRMSFDRMTKKFFSNSPFLVSQMSNDKF